MAIKHLFLSPLILISILVLAFSLRILNVNTNPLYGDELTIVYDAYSILKTGSDQTGQSFPLTFSMGAGRPAGYVYGSVPFVAVWEPTTLGVRGLSVVSGVVVVLLMFLLGKLIFSKEVGLLSALLMAISPWNLSLSTGGFESHFALALALAGTVSFIYATKNSSKGWLIILSAIFFGLTIHTYPTYKLTLLPFLVLLSWYTDFHKLFRERLRIYLVAGVVILAFFGAISVSQTFTAGSEGRFLSINIFSDERVKKEITQKVNLDREASRLPYFLPAVFHNKLVEYGTLFTKNYLENFSFSFLFLEGDRNPRHNMAGTGSLYFIELILIFTAIFYLVQQRNKKTLLFIISWVIIAPLATAFLMGTHALRNAFMLPPLILISSVGLMHIWKLNQTFIKSAVVLAFIIQFIFIVNNLYFLSPNKYARFWSDPAKKISELALTNKANFDFVILSDRIENIEFAYPTYTKIDPSVVINQNRQRSKLGKYEFKKFDNVYIGNVPDHEVEIFLKNLEGSALFLVPADQKGILGGLTAYSKDGVNILYVKKEK